MSRRSFSTEFKRQAVHLVLSEGLPVQTVAMKLEVHTNSLYRCILESEKYGEPVFLGQGSKEFIKQNRIKQLENKNIKLKEALELLKKFEAFLKANSK
jgi:transposase